jgi:hypothetical protein
MKAEWLMIDGIKHNLYPDPESSLFSPELPSPPPYVCAGLSIVL